MGMPRLAELASDELMEEMRASGRDRLSAKRTMPKNRTAVVTAPTAVTSSGAAKTSWSFALLRVSNSRAGLATKNVRALSTGRAFSPRILRRPTNMPTRMMAQTTKKPASTPSMRFSAAGLVGGG